MWPVGDGMGWWMLWGGLMMVLFWGVIMALVVWGVQAMTRREAGHKESRQTSPSPRPPLGIAKERYACGNLARDEFERIKSDLEGS